MTSKLPFYLVLTVVLVAFLVVAFRVDFTPRVESDFFFSTDDPELRATREIESLFPTRPQVLISATGPDLRAPDYIASIRRLTTALEGLDGVAEVQSLTHGPPSPGAVFESPVWKRLLLGSNPRLSQLVVLLESAPDGAAVESGEVVRQIEAIVERHHTPSFALEVSGVPYVLELIRRHLLRDLRVFTLAAFAVFGLLVTLVYRSLRIMSGTLFTCLSAGATTLAVLHVIGIPIGLLTANIVTVVFVLTLSHIVFLTANWRRALGETGAGTLPAGGRDAVDRAVGRTFQASFWSMVTTFLGFSSLLFASAKPLRELGLSGAVGTALAIVMAYSLYPAFLRGLVAPPERRLKISARLPSRRVLGWIVAAIFLVTLVAALGVPRLDTDPSLLDYFAPDDEIRHGIELVDLNGGSSPLYIVVSDGGARLDGSATQARLAELHTALESEAEVGSALSLPVILAEAQRIPLARFLAPEALLALVESTEYRDVVRGFVTEDKTRTLFFLRLRESGRAASRREVVERLVDHATAAGLEVERVGGLYELQGKLGELVKSSLLQGLSALMALFVVITALVGRSLRTTLAMATALAVVPLLLLGALGWAGIPMDVISSPAANVSIALGIDAMIHLVIAVRRRRRAGDDDPTAWRQAVDELWRPVLGAALILAVGFGLFALSSFPPTQRFGIVVGAGTFLAAAMALLVLPFLATLDRARSRPARA